MQHQKKTKKFSKKRNKPTNPNRAENHYQKDNSLTLYFEKLIGPKIK